jgi:hypothetical protein
VGVHIRPVSLKTPELQQIMKRSGWLREAEVPH